MTLSTEREPMDGQIAIQCNNLTKRFGDFTAVDGISFDVKKGEIFGFLGPNGAGKSTTIRMLCTLSAPSGGSATVAGYDVVQHHKQVREHIGLVSEKLIMYNDLTARENLKLFGKLYSLPNDVVRKRVDELLSYVRMEKWADARIGSFSTGMKQRINVIRALVNQPDILFLDEPTLGLDPQSTAEIRDLTKKINAEHGTTIILTTHMMAEADMLCDRIGIIDKGKIVALDTPPNLKMLVTGMDTTSLELEISNMAPGIISAVKSLACASSVVQEAETHLKVRATGEDCFDVIIDAVRNAGGKIKAARNLEPSLEDVFLQITGREVRDQVSETVSHKGGPRHGPGGGPPGARGGGGRVR
jgi:ABC-2 type transport system ATP-binding protein